VPLPSLSRDKDEANQVASPNLDGPNHSAAFSAAALCGMRWAAALGQAMAIRGCAGQAVGAEGTLGKAMRGGILIVGLALAGVWLWWTGDETQVERAD
jgi:hypothetical protein